MIQKSIDNRKVFPRYRFYVTFTLKYVPVDDSKFDNERIDIKYQKEIAFAKMVNYFNYELF